MADWLNAIAQLLGQPLPGDPGAEPFKLQSSQTLGGDLFKLGQTPQDATGPFKLGGVGAFGDQGGRFSLPPGMNTRGDTPELKELKERLAQRTGRAQAGTLPGQQAGQFASTVGAVAGVPDQYKAFVAEAAQQSNLDPALIAAVMGQESGGNATAVSPAGASGLMQLMPTTARGLGVQNINDPRENILAGARYLRQQMDAFGQNLDLALAAYNAGPGAVQAAGNAVPQFAETQRYVPAVRQRYEQLRQQSVAAPPAAPVNAMGYTFPVVGYQGRIDTHHGSVRGGSDIMAPEGTPVVAMRGGQILNTGSGGPGGNWIMAQGDDGLQYYYAHLRDAPLVSRGPVQAGQPLGFVGRTGNAATTPPHLHLGVGPSILNGVGPYGGTGGDYDAIALLMQVLAAAAAGR